jgi:glycosyltransferase involved in cell wall biosynthesis
MSRASKRQHLLFIAPVMPDAGGNGLAMRQGQCLAAYAPRFTIDLAVIPLAGPVDAKDAFARRYVARLQVFPPSGTDTYFALLRRIRDPAQRLAAFHAYGKPSIQAGLTNDIKDAFAGWIAGQKYDLIHTARLYMLALETGLAVPHIVDADEDDSRVFTQMAVQAGTGAAWWRAEAAHAARDAAARLPRVQHIFAACAADAQALRHYGPLVTVIPNSVPARRPPPRRPGRKILFVGTMGYRPNQAGIVWFLKYCWPRLRKSMPGITLDIVGGGVKTRSHHGALRHGWVRDLAAFYQRAGAVIVPLHAGGGSRIKMLEAAAHGVPIIATRIGAQGSALRPGRDYLAADGPAAFIRAVRRALALPRLGHAARRAAAQHHAAAPIARRIAAIAIAEAI